MGVSRAKRLKERGAKLRAYGDKALASFLRSPGCRTWSQRGKPAWFHRKAHWRRHKKVRISGEEYLRASRSVGLVRRATGAFSRSSIAMSPLEAPVVPAVASDSSLEAKDVLRVVSIVKGEPDVREEVVASLREQIENGTYNVSGVQIGEMMIRRMRADRVA